MKKTSYIISLLVIALFLISMIGVVNATDNIKPLAQTDSRGVGDNLGSGSYDSNPTGNIGDQVKPAPQTDSRGVGVQIRPANQQNLPSDGNGNYVASQGSTYSSKILHVVINDTAKLNAILNNTGLNTTSNATGNATFVLNKTSDKLSYNLTYSGLSSNETGAEINFPGVIINSTTNETLSSYQLPLGALKSGTFVILDAVKNYFISNQAWVRIKSILFPGGEISGQIRII